MTYYRKDVFMMKKFKYLYLLILIMLIPMGVSAEDACTKFELDKAVNDYKFEKVSCFDNYNSALGDGKLSSHKGSFRRNKGCGS